jgi:hypothetical protein
MKHVATIHSLRELDVSYCHRLTDVGLGSLLLCETHQSSQFSAVT